MSAPEIQPGFADPVDEANQVFRQVLQALAGSVR